MNAPKHLDSPPSDDLPWLAFLYVSEELTPEELVDFEERLLTDQAAREAVAEAMKMTEGLWMALAEKPLPAGLSSQKNLKKAGWRRMGWIASSVIAAGLAFSVGWWVGQPGDSSKPAVPEVSQSGTPLVLSEVDGALQLVEIWSDAQSLVDELAVGLAMADRAEYLEELPPRESAEPDEEAFAWMLAAISSDAGSGSNASQDEPAVMEN